MRTKRDIRTVTVQALCALVLAFVSFTTHATEKGESAPTFSLTSMDGKKQSLTDLKGKVVYLDFWASWCGPCRYSLPYMKTLQDRYGKDGLVVLAINIDSDRTRAERALTDVDPNYLVLLDPTGSVPSLYNPPKMPSSFIIGRDGTVAAVHLGFKPEETDDITVSIEKALKGAR